MTIQDLIDALQERIDEGHNPEAEVRVAHQPQWPFEYSIAGLSRHSPLSEEWEDIYRQLSTDSELTDEDRIAMRDRIMEIEQTMQSEPLMLVEGSQVDYTTSRHWDEI